MRRRKTLFARAFPPLGELGRRIPGELGPSVDAEDDPLAPSVFA